MEKGIDEDHPPGGREMNIAIYSTYCTVILKYFTRYCKYGGTSISRALLYVREVR